MMAAALAVPRRSLFSAAAHQLNAIYYRLTFLSPKYFHRLTFSRMGGGLSIGTIIEVTHFPLTEATHLLRSSRTLQPSSFSSFFSFKCLIETCQIFVVMNVLNNLASC